MESLEILAYKPCIGCAHCCCQAVCTLGQQRNITVNDLPCPMLIWDGQRHWCKIILQEPRLHKTVSDSGCPSTVFNDFRKNLKDRTRRDSCQKNKEYLNPQNIQLK